MDSSTHFNIIVPKNIPVAALNNPIFNENLVQTIVNKATLFYYALKYHFGELLTLLLNNQNFPR